MTLAPLTNPHRFRPTRYGIVGLYQYADQIFCAEGGRLALRGRNTSGKSKALELLMPFVLDGDITPRKLDPFAKDTKSMRWNLIECTDSFSASGKRVGYVWAEFQRTTPDGAVEVVTCGVGLEATRNTEGLKDRWYFVTAQRVGLDLALVRQRQGGEEPMPKAEFQEALKAGGGENFSRQVTYKEALRERLLPFPSAALYEQHLEIIRQLRKPKLSDKLDDRGLSTLLTSTLPEVDDALMRRLGDSLERLEDMHVAVRTLESARDLIADLGGGAFKSYALGVIQVRGEALRRSDGAYEAARAAQRKADDEAEAAVLLVGQLQEKLDLVDSEFRRAQAALETMLDSKKYKGLSAIDNAQRELTEATTRLEQEERAELAARRARTISQEALDVAQSELDSAQDALRAKAGVLRETAVRAGLTIDDPVDTPRLNAFEQRLTLRDTELKDARRLHDTLRQEALGLETLREQLEEAHHAVEHAHEGVAEARGVLERARESAEEALSAWYDDQVEMLQLTDDQLETLGRNLTAGEDCRAALSAMAAPHLQTLVETRVGLNFEIGQLADQRATLQARLADLEASGVPELASRSPLRAARDQRLGAPLWLICDFRKSVPQEERGPLEAALMESGVLDAWISPDHEAADSDSTLIANPANGPTLASFLKAAPGTTGLAAELIESILRSVPTEGDVHVAPGRFRAGPLHGRYNQDRAELIGAAAREEHRQAQIAQIQTELLSLSDDHAALSAKLDSVQHAEALIAREQVDFPSNDAVRSALDGERAAGQTLALAEGNRDIAVERRDKADGRVTQAREAVEAHARSAGIPSDSAGLESLDRAVQMARSDLNPVRLALAACEHSGRARERAADQVNTETERNAEAERRTGFARAAVAEAQGRLESHERKLANKGASPEEIRAQAQALRDRREELDKERRATETDRTQAVANEVKASNAAERAAAEVTTAADQRNVALNTFRVVGPHDLFSAALGTDAPDDERESLTWTLTTALERLRSLPISLDETPSLDRRASRVADQVSELSKQLVEFEMDVATRYDDGLTLVQMSWLGQPMTLPQMERELAEDLERREHVLSEERSKVFSDALLTEIAEHLRSRVSEVKASVRSRNHALRKCLTGAGRRVEMRWERALESDAERAVLRLLEGSAVDMLREAERAQLSEFLQERIAAARIDFTDSLGEKSATDYLTRAFDYRGWWQFSLWVHEKDDPNPKRLTAKTQGAGSGGEQSVLLHLPLFATAASMYDMVPNGPRIIALDEAMDGIDDPTREAMFAVLVDLDLDVFMTSFDINPCVATVPEVGFYELHRDNADWGIFAEHFMWDGKSKLQVIDA